MNEELKKAAERLRLFNCDDAEQMKNDTDLHCVRAIIAADWLSIHDRLFGVKMTKPETVQ